jgi:proteasome-associated ATPase
MDEQEHIEREVRRRAGIQSAELHRQIGELREELQHSRDKIDAQTAVIEKLTAQPLSFGTLLAKNDSLDPMLLAYGDEVLVTDPSSPHYHKIGKICSGLEGRPVVQDGVVKVELEGSTLIEEFTIDGAESQVRLTQKTDGTYAVVAVDGKRWLINGSTEPSLLAGESVLVHTDSKQILGRSEEPDYGPVCRVAAVSGGTVEIVDRGESRHVLNPKNINLEPGDRVLVDAGYMLAIRKAAKEDASSYRLTADATVTWDEIGGLEDAKRMSREAIESPFLHPEVFRHYGIKKEAGLLYYGPPGCGKTLLARACASAVARLHGREFMETGYIYVKAPELLDKWVGNTEAKIRNIFDRGRRHFKKYGFPAIAAFDEADAIFCQRGFRKTSDMADTIVPMFLGEMDGVDEEQTKANPIIILMTNRPDMLDPAVIRPGRISKHIKIDRPNVETALDILKIHTGKLPFDKPEMKSAILTILAQDIFSKSRIMYRVNGEHDFTFGDACNGALLASIVESAKMHAVRRDLASGKPTGVTIDDLRAAVKEVYDQQKGLNHSFDLLDFAERKGIAGSDLSTEKVFSST